MQSSKEELGEIRKPQVNDAEKQGKTIEWERLEISRILEIPNISCKDRHNKDRNSMDLTEAEEI